MERYVRAGEEPDFAEILLDPVYRLMRHADRLPVRWEDPRQAPTVRTPDRRAA